MAITITFDTPQATKGQFFSGSEKVRRGTFNLGTYVTNGVAVAASDFKLKELRHLVLENSHVNGEIYAWDRANGKIKAYSAVGTEQTQIDISANVARYQAFGK